MTLQNIIMVKKSVIHTQIIGHLNGQLETVESEIMELFFSDSVIRWS